MRQITHVAHGEDAPQRNFEVDGVIGRHTHARARSHTYTRIRIDPKFTLLWRTDRHGPRRDGLSLFKGDGLESGRRFTFLVRCSFTAPSSTTAAGLVTLCSSSSLVGGSVSLADFPSFPPAGGTVLSWPVRWRSWCSGAGGSGTAKNWSSCSHGGGEDCLARTWGPFFVRTTLIWPRPSGVERCHATAGFFTLFLEMFFSLFCWPRPRSNSGRW